MVIHRYTYILSKRLDPVFAITMGTIAAGLRIRRDEEEHGRPAQQAFDTLKRRIALAWNSGTSGS